MKNEIFIAFEAMMKESPYSKFDSGYDGTIPECPTCGLIVRFGKTNRAYLRSVPTPSAGQATFFEVCRIVIKNALFQ